MLNGWALLYWVGKGGIEMRLSLGLDNASSLGHHLIMRIQRLGAFTRSINFSLEPCRVICLFVFRVKLRNQWR